MGELITAKLYYKQQQDDINVPDLWESIGKQRAAGNLRLDQFFELIFNMLNILKPGLVITPAFPGYLIPGTKEFIATMDNPTENFTDTITYKIVREEPASIGGSKQPFSSATREITPRLREEVPYSNRSNVREIYGQLFDTLVHFDC